jgi:hypothetical protein
MMISSRLLPVFLLSAVSSPAQIVVRDRGLTAPALEAGGTGFTGDTGDRWGWDAGEGFTQTFTLPEAGTIQSIFIGYNAFDDGETVTLELLVNDSVVGDEILLNGDDFSGSSATDDNQGPFYWMEFDLSSENVLGMAGLNSFTMRATADTGESWPLAPRYVAPSGYEEGELSLDFAGRIDIDLAFAVTLETDNPVGLQVREIAFDNSGALIMTFAGKSDTTYEITKSGNLEGGSFAALASPLTVTTNESGVGSATVPASEASEASAYFRLEERP